MTHDTTHCSNDTRHHSLQQWYTSPLTAAMIHVATHCSNDAAMHYELCCTKKKYKMHIEVAKNYHTLKDGKFQKNILGHIHHARPWLRQPCMSWHPCPLWESCWVQRWASLRARGRPGHRWCAAPALRRSRRRPPRGRLPHTSWTHCCEPRGTAISDRTAPNIQYYTAIPNTATSIWRQKVAESNTATKLGILIVNTKFGYVKYEYAKIKLSNHC